MTQPGEQKEDPPKDFVIRTEGQRLLLEVKLSLAGIAAAVGVSSRQTVADWRKGVKMPGAAARAKLFAAYGIPATAWVTMPGTAAAAPAAAGDAPSSTAISTRGPTPSTLEGCLALLISVREARGVAGLLPAEKVRLVDAEGRLLALQHRLEREQQLLEDRLVREHPEWQRLKRALVKVLVAYPAAAQAVADMLRDFQ